MVSATIHCVFSNMVNAKAKITACVKHMLILLIVNDIVGEQQTVCLLKPHYEVSYLAEGRGWHRGEVCRGVRDRSSAAVQHTCLCEWGAERGMEFAWAQKSVCLVFDMKHSLDQDKAWLEPTNTDGKVDQKTKILSLFPYPHASQTCITCKRQYFEKGYIYCMKIIYLVCFICFFGV